MLKGLIAMWKQKGFMNKVVEEFCGMLRDDAYILSSAWAVMRGERSVEAAKQPLYEKDRSVNSQEQEIRRRLLEHLSINPGQDVSGCLILMSLVKDAERIGDYAKNIFDLRVILEKDAGDMRHFNRLCAIEEKLAKHLQQLAEGFGTGNGELAKTVLDSYAPLKEECSKILFDLFREDLPTQEAVATALLSRFLKRINSHTCNIASGLVYPLDKIDFVRGEILE